MQKISEGQYRRMGTMFKGGHDIRAIARSVKLSDVTVRQFIDGNTTNPIGMTVFEEMTRPPGITKPQHEAWLADNGYRGFAKRPD